MQVRCGGDTDLPTWSVWPAHTCRPSSLWLTVYRRPEGAARLAELSTRPLSARTRTQSVMSPVCRSTGSSISCGSSRPVAGSGRGASTVKVTLCLRTDWGSPLTPRSDTSTEYGSPMKRPWLAATRARPAASLATEHT